MNIIELAQAVKESSFHLAATSHEIRNCALLRVAQLLDDNKELIFRANKLDLEEAEKQQMADPILSRLKFDHHKLQDVIEGILSLSKMEDPLNKILLKRTLDEGLLLEKITCPIGVIGVIFESRPDALVQISALCIKSGNSTMLKGGSEALNTNRVLFELIRKAGEDIGLPSNFAVLLESREDIKEMLKCHKSIDLIIPRGSNEFVRYIQDNSKIPVMGHSDGICHIYIDKSADLSKGLSIIVDSKTQYVAACNTVETLLVHQDIAGDFLPLLLNELKGKVTLKGCEKTQEIISVEKASEDDFTTEYLDYILSIKIVTDYETAINHINKYGSHHTDCVVTQDPAVADSFFSLVDSAGVYQNCSTRFADGFRYGFGAEVGISTGKLHARGPVGLDGIVTYKYRLVGHGHIVSDYSEGRKSFHFKDL
jgi:glutamate-5-semialdehyde dehydrogenase